MKLYLKLGLGCLCLSTVAHAQQVAFNELAKQCATQIHPATIQALVRTESAFNPYAIGVVDGSVKQPHSLPEAIHTALMLQAQGANFSMGLAQINKYNLPKYDLTYERVFDPCLNLKAAQAILSDCFVQAQHLDANPQQALDKALSCYYSGNFRTGFMQDFQNQPNYVQRVKNAAKDNNDHEMVKLVSTNDTTPTPQVPALDANSPTPVVVKVSSKKRTTGGLTPSNPTQQNTSSEDSPKGHAQWDAFGDW